MSFLKRFSFWLPVLAVIHYIIELLYNPVKDIIFALDPLLGKTFWALNIHDFLYDSEHSKILFPGLLVHLFVWLIYGIIIDYIFKLLFRQDTR
ncbi:hypothetical protein SAMN04244570_0909 [Sporosarcina newyorkensis]|uniref:Uncharacterized protein n=1 Tax=Sporosarcina newyorkensis TaxID=759851 RepID=A0A1T4XKB9_9BACL|nr:hypothetical protein SAMN04244570_0909 [Sporosarcina newyorkensis]